MGFGENISIGPPRRDNNNNTQKTSNCWFGCQELHCLSFTVTFRLKIFGKELQPTVGCSVNPGNFYSLWMIYSEARPPCIDNSSKFQTGITFWWPETICAPSSFCCTQNGKNSFRIRGGYVLRVNQRFLFHPEMTSYGSNRIKGM